MDEGKLPEEAVDGLSDRILWPFALMFFLITVATFLLTFLWLLLGLIIVLGIVGLGWSRAALFASLGIICLGGVAHPLFREYSTPVLFLLSLFPTVLILNLTDSAIEKWKWAFISVTSLAIGTFSGNLGTAGRMFTFFTQNLNLDFATAETLVFVIRKSVHIGCYGTLAALLYLLMPKDKPARWLGAALAAMSFAAFDEWRQSMTPGRTGTATDLLWDMLGVTLALLLVIGIPKWRSKRLSGSGLAS